MDKTKDGGKAMEYAFGDDGQPILKSFDDLYTDEEVKFVLYFDQDGYEELKAHPEEFEKRFRLTSTWRTTNMVAFDASSKITRYGSVGAILEAYYVPRLAAYEERRLKEIDRLEREALEADAKARFIRAVLAVCMCRVPSSSNLTSMTPVARSRSLDRNVLRRLATCV